MESSQNLNSIVTKPTLWRLCHLAWASVPDVIALRYILHYSAGVHTIQFYDSAGVHIIQFRLRVEALRCPDEHLRLKFGCVIVWFI